MKKISNGIIVALLSFLLFLNPVFSTISIAASNTTKTVAIKATSNETDKYIYYAIYNKIYKVNKKTKAIKLIHTVKKGGFTEITIYKNYIYCSLNLIYGSGDFYSYIYRVKTDGTKGEYIEQGHTPVVYDGKIYYSRLSLGSNRDDIKNLGLYKMNLNGDNKTRLDSSAEFCMRYYKSYIYYSNDNGIYRIGINGKNKEKIANNDEMYIFDIYGDCIYYNYSYYKSGSSYYEDGIFKYNIKTKKTTKILSNSIGHDVDNSYIYYTVKKGDKYYMYKMNLSSKKKTSLTSGGVISDLIVRGDYILYNSYISPNNTVNIIKTNGKEKKLLNKY